MSTMKKRSYLLIPLFLFAFSAFAQKTLIVQNRTGGYEEYARVAYNIISVFMKGQNMDDNHIVKFSPKCTLSKDDIKQLGGKFRKYYKGVSFKQMTLNIDQNTSDTTWFEQTYLKITKDSISYLMQIRVTFLISNVEIERYLPGVLNIEVRGPGECIKYDGKKIRSLAQNMSRNK